MFCYRLKDGTGSWAGGNTRFQATNICDFICFNGERLYMLELKSTKGKSLPFGNIKQTQIDGLNNASKYHNVTSGFLINIDNDVYFLHITVFMYFQEHTTRKSIPKSYIEERGIYIPSELLQVNYRYDLKRLFDK